MRGDVLGDHLGPPLGVLRVGEERQEDLFREHGQLLHGLPRAVSEHQHAPEVLHRDRQLLLPYEVGELRPQLVGEVRHGGELAARRRHHDEQGLIRGVEEIQDDLLQGFSGFQSKFGNFVNFKTIENLGWARKREWKLQNLESVTKVTLLGF